jgi:hypothetical protein
MRTLICPSVRNFIFAFICCSLFNSVLAQAQNAAPDIYARVLYSKVDASNVNTYLKLMKEQVKPALQQAQQSGALGGWVLYEVGFGGTESAYNFVSVLIYDTWAKTENLPNLEELMKKANPNLDAAATAAQLGSIRKIVKQEFYHREDMVAGPANVIPKYILINYMKPKPGMTTAYIKDEKEAWKPVHQEFAKSGQTAGWSLWSLIMPSGSQQPFDYVTVDDFEDYAKINAVKYQETIKKVYPTKTPEAFFEQSAKTHDRVRAELWHTIEQL